MTEKKNNVVALTTKAYAGEQTPPKTKPLLGEPLLRALGAKAHEMGHTRPDVAAALGVTAGYLQQLESGLRNIYTISDEFCGACARYLGLPRLQVLNLAGRIKPQDYFTEEDRFRQEVQRAIRFIEADAKWCSVLTKELQANSLETLCGVVRLYEAATGTVLLTSRQEDAPAQSA